MGFFSWVTQDTKKSIANSFSDKETFEVTMSDNKGGKWTQRNYNGYGIFGGKDFYELLAEMNGKETREEGIELAFSSIKFLSPNLNEDPEIKWNEGRPELCESQGYFY